MGGDFDYDFPERRFSEAELEVSQRQRIYFRELAEYTSVNYGAFEVANGGVKSSYIGSVYQQRLSSSIKAANDTINRRLKYIEYIRERLNEGATDFSLPPQTYLLNDSEDEGFFNSSEFNLEGDCDSVISACSSEILMLRQLKDVIEDCEIKEGDDPKITRMYDLIQSSSNGILVFSRFVSTLNSAKSYLISKGLNFGFITGKECFSRISNIKQKEKFVSLNRKIAEGEIKVILCSEAASEGVNLQSASELINLDVPWNPARLEQRIGRIARLGQKKDVVDIHNLWYPESIERAMYKRLFERKEDYEMLIGGFPAIFEPNIHEKIGISPEDIRTFNFISEKRDEYASFLLEENFDSEKNLELNTLKALREIVSNLSLPVEVPVDLNSVSFHNDIWRVVFDSSIDSRDKEEKDLFFLYRNEIPLLPYFKDGGKRFFVPPVFFPDLIKAVFFIKPFEKRNSIFLEVEDCFVERELARNGYIPDENFLTFPEFRKKKMKNEKFHSKKIARFFFS